jgi:hypothetical protein
MRHKYATFCTIEIAALDTGTALREKLMIKNPKLVFHSNSYIAL